MVTRSGARHRGCGMIGVRLRAVGPSCNGKRQSSGLRGNRGSFECGLQSSKSVMGIEEQLQQV